MECYQHNRNMILQWLPVPSMSEILLYLIIIIIMFNVPKILNNIIDITLDYNNITYLN